LILYIIQVLDRKHFINFSLRQFCFFIVMSWKLYDVFFFSWTIATYRHLPSGYTTTSR